MTGQSGLENLIVRNKVTASISVSIVICTYNRADSLKLTLDSLCRMEVGNEFRWEIILIINNSTDHTESVAESFKPHLPIKVFFEKKQGLAHARNRGIVESEGGLLVFTDDDVNVSPHWLSEYYKNFSRQRGVDYFGGPIHPVWSESGKNKKPKWLKNLDMPLLGGLLGMYDLKSSDRLYQPQDMHPYGANFAITRETADELGVFNSKLGMKGDVPGRGEEAEYFMRMQLLNKVGFYINSAQVEHRFENDRLRMGYLYRYGRQKGIAGHQIQLAESSVKADSESCVSPINFFLQQVKLLLKAWVKKYTGAREQYVQSIILLGIRSGHRSSGD